MAFVRILIDGYSLLHAWPALARGHARHSATAREALIRAVGQYADAAGVPITIIFDGGGTPVPVPKVEMEAGLEVVYSAKGQTADDLIERVAHRLKAFGEFLVVTNDHAERDMVLSLGGMASSCANFIQEMDGSRQEFQAQLKKHNRQELHRYKRAAAR